MRKKNVQISLFDTYTDVCRTMEEDKPAFLSLLDEHIDFEAIIPPRFYHASRDTLTLRLSENRFALNTSFSLSSDF